MTSPRVSREEVMAALDGALTALTRELGDRELSLGWTPAKRDEMIEIVGEWHDQIANAPSVTPQLRRHLIRWFFDNEVDTDGLGDLVLAADALLDGASEETGQPT